MHPQFSPSGTSCPFRRLSLVALCCFVWHVYAVPTDALAGFGRNEPRAAGFTHDGDWYDYEAPDGSLQQLVEAWPHRNPETSLGVYDYADFNYAHLAYIVEKVSGIPIEVFIEERVLRPLGLRNTFTGFESAPEWRSRLNAWYRWNEQTRAFDLRWTTDWSGWTFYPGGWGLLSTATDYAQFLSMWMHGGQWRSTRLLREETVELALQPHGVDAGSVAYGYGTIPSRPTRTGSLRPRTIRGRRSAGIGPDVSQSRGLSVFR